MKTIFLKFAFLLCFMQLLSACMYRYLPQKDRGQLMTYPVIPHKKDVEVYFGNEKPADTAYLKLRIIDMYAGIYTSTAEMVEAMKVEAQNYGIDALLMLDDKSLTEASTTWAWWRQGTPTYTTYDNKRFMYALGIKYKRNISQVDKYIRRQEIELYDSVAKTYKPILAVDVELNGIAKNIHELKPKQIGYYHNFIKKYSLPWLIDDKSADWQSSFYSEEPPKVPELTFVRVYAANDWAKKIRVTYSYNKLMQIEKIRLKSPERKPQFLHYTYLEKTQQPSLLTVTEKNKMIYKQIFVYDDQQKLQNSLFYKIENDKEIPFLKVNYIYYQKSDF